LKEVGGPAVVLYAACNAAVEKFDPTFNRGSEVVERQCFLNERPFQSIEGFLEINKK